MWPSEDLLWRWLPFLSRRVSSRFGMLAFIFSDGCAEAITVAGSGCSAGLCWTEDEEGLTRSPMARGYLAMSNWHISSREEAVSRLGSGLGAE